MLADKIIKECKKACTSVKIRKLLDMPGYFQDKKAVAKLSKRNPTIYEVYAFTPSKKDGNLAYAITVLKAGKIGSEFFFTKGHFHKKKSAGEVYIGLKGMGKILLQNKKGRTKIVPLQKNKTFFVPPGWAHRTVNVGKKDLVFLAIYPVDAGHDYKIKFKKRIIK